jgi:hypothetical protein
MPNASWPGKLKTIQTAAGGVIKEKQEDGWEEMEKTP